jgi:O-antigen ligase
MNVVTVDDTHRDFMQVNARRLLMIGAFLMPMLTFRVGGQTTATTETGLTISDAFFFGAVILVALSVRRRRLPPTRTWYIGIAFVVVGGMAATFHAVLPTESIFVVARMLFVLLIWQWTIRHLVTDEDRMRSIMTAYVLGCVVSAMVAVLQLDAHVLVSLGTVFNGRATGLARHPDDTGSFLALGLTFAVGLALHPSHRRRWFYIACAFLIAVGLIVSGSVSGMLCGLAGCLVIMVLSGIKVKHFVAIVLILVAGYVGGTSIQGSSGKSLNPIARFEAATGPEANGANSVTPRVGTWKGSWRGIVESPFLGHGLDILSSLTYLDPNNDTEYPTHNFILMAWYQGGILFLVGDLICIAEALRRMLMNGKPDGTRRVLFGGAVAVLLFAMQAPMMFDRYFWFPFVLAMAYPLANATRRRAASDGAHVLTLSNVGEVRTGTVIRRPQALPQGPEPLTP